MNTSPLVRWRSGLIVLLTGAAVLMAFLTFFRTSIVQAYTLDWFSTDSKDLPLVANPGCNGHTGNILFGPAVAHATKNSSQPVDLSSAVNLLYEGVSMIDVLIRSGIAVAAMLGGFGNVGAGDFGPATGTAASGMQPWEWPATARSNDIVVSNDWSDGL